MDNCIAKFHTSLPTLGASMISLAATTRQDFSPELYLLDLSVIINLL